MCQEQRGALRIASRSQVQPQPPWSFCFHKQTQAVMQEASEGALRGGAHCDLSVTDFIMECPRPHESTKNSQPAQEQEEKEDKDKDNDEDEDEDDDDVALILGHWKNLLQEQTGSGLERGVHIKPQI